jgi:hypothetical protein
MVRRIVIQKCVADAHLQDLAPGAGAGDGDYDAESVHRTSFCRSDFLLLRCRHLAVAGHAGAGERSFPGVASYRVIIAVSVSHDTDRSADKARQNAHLGRMRLCRKVRMISR